MKTEASKKTGRTNRYRWVAPLALLMVGPAIFSLFGSPFVIGSPSTGTSLQLFFDELGRILMILGPMYAGVLIYRAQMNTPAKNRPPRRTIAVLMGIGTSVLGWLLLLPISIVFLAIRGTLLSPL